MIKCKAGIQITTDYPELQLVVVAENGDIAWLKAATYYRQKMGLSNDDLIGMVLFDFKETKNKRTSVRKI